MQLTPPYSLFSNKDYSTLSSQEKYKWLEFHKWKFNISWFTKIVENLVLNVRMKTGFMGIYNNKIGAPPFERFFLGGDGLSTYALDGREVIGMRGYDDSSLTPTVDGTAVGGTIFNKFTMELRYPISLNPSATIYLLAFAEAGKSWLDKRQYSPFNLYKSAGVGIRIYLPMFGLLGFDWGYGFDEVPGDEGANGSRFHISINQSID
jgi:outer membrane protein insertion porin family